MDSIPSPTECLALLKENGCSDDVVHHCKAVRDVAVKMAQRAHADVKLVEAAALLHDIGRSKTHGILHGVEGAKIAKKLDLPEIIVHIIERHLGAGITLETAKQLGLPPKDYTPQTLEEKIVCHADNLIDNCQRQPIEHEVERALRDGYKEYAEHLASLHKELSNICGMDLNLI